MTFTALQLTWRRLVGSRERSAVGRAARDRHAPGLRSWHPGARRQAAERRSVGRQQEGSE